MTSSSVLRVWETYDRRCCSSSWSSHQRSDTPRHTPSRCRTESPACRRTRTCHTRSYPGRPQGALKSGRAWIYLRGWWQRTEPQTPSLLLLCSQGERQDARLVYSWRRSQTERESLRFTQISKTEAELTSAAEFIDSGENQNSDWPRVTVSVRLPAVSQLDHIFGWLLVGHQVIIGVVSIVVSTHATELQRKKKGEKCNLC